MCCFVHVVHRDAQRWHSPTSGRTWCIAVRHRSPLPILYYPSSPAAVTVSDSHLRIVVVFLFSLSAPPFATRINFALASICPPNDGARSLSHASCSPYSSQFLTSLLLHTPLRGTTRLSCRILAARLWAPSLSLSPVHRSRARRAQNGALLIGRTEGAGPLEQYGEAGYYSLAAGPCNHATPPPHLHPRRVLATQGPLRGGSHASKRVPQNKVLSPSTTPD